MTDSLFDNSEDQLYNVEKILDKKKVGGKVLYKVKWEGYDIDQCTWEPLKNLFNVQKFINEYEKKHKQRNQNCLNKKHKRNISLSKSKNSINSKEKKSGQKSLSKTNNEIVSNFDSKKKQKINFDDEYKSKSKKSKKSFKNKSSFNSKKSPKSMIKNDEESDFIDKIYPEYKYDESFNKVLSIKKSKNGILCKVEYIDENNICNVKNILAKNLRKINPNILLDFYENKIKFVKDNK